MLLHGTGGTAYDEVKDELDSAKKHGYAIIALQWLDKETGRFFPPAVVSLLAEKSLHYAAEKHGVDADKAALCGFSRGGAISYEVAWRDSQEHRHFKLVISHSGGVPRDAVVAPRDNARPDAFFSQLNNGELAADSYHGCRFFLYSGDRDEQWGLEMSEKMANAQKVLPRAGAQVVEWVRDPEGGHFGYRSNPEIHEKAILHFERLTAAK